MTGLERTGMEGNGEERIGMVTLISDGVVV